MLCGSLGTVKGPKDWFKVDFLRSFPFGTDDETKMSMELLSISIGFVESLLLSFSGSRNCKSSPTSISLASFP